MVKGGAKVKVGYVETGKGCSRCRQGAVEEEFDSLKRSCASADITRIGNAVTSKGDACTVWITFLWPYFADNPGVGDITATVRRDVMKMNRGEGVCTGNVFLVWRTRESTNALA